MEPTGAPGIAPPERVAPGARWGSPLVTALMAALIESTWFSAASGFAGAAVAAAAAGAAGAAAGLANAATAATAAGAAGAAGSGRVGSFFGSDSLVSRSVTAAGSTDLAGVSADSPGRCLGRTCVCWPRSSAGGSSTVAVVPPRGLRASETVMPCRVASRLTTSRPIRRAVSAVTSPPERRSSLSELSTSWAMPRPPSLISTMVLSPACLVEIFTGAVGGEKASALSTSSVIRCTTSEAAAPLTFSGGEDSIWTRWYSCTPAIAAWNTSPSASASFSLVCTGASASTISESAVRRMREARWSRRNSDSRRFGSSSSFSSRSIRPSCWLMSEVLRRDRVENISPTCERSWASPDARCTACRCMSSTARASWPISSWVCTAIGVISPGSSPARILATISGSRVFATSRAPSRTRRIGFSSMRETSRARKIAASSSATVTTALAMARPRASLAASVRFLSMSLSRSTLRSS